MLLPPFVGDEIKSGCVGKFCATSFVKMVRASCWELRLVGEVYLTENAPVSAVKFNVVGIIYFLLLLVVLLETAADASFLLEL